MSKIEWDKRTGGVVLKRHITKETLSVSPRPVFFEELDLLKLADYGWKYPKCQEPLMWACNKQYFYRGDQVFEVKGANIYDAPTIIFKPGFENGLKLKPVNVEAMLKRNRDELFVIESEAIEFIRDTYLMYASTLKTVEAAPANELDYEALAARAEKRTKTKMAIVKEDCDSFDVMPLEKAEAEGKRVYQTTRIDRFLASFSGVVLRSYENCSALPHAEDGRRSTSKSPHIRWCTSRGKYPPFSLRKNWQRSETRHSDQCSSYSLLEYCRDLPVSV